MDDYSKMSEIELTERLKNSDKEALEEIAKREKERCLFLIRRILHEKKYRQEDDIIFYESVTKLWEKREILQGTYKPYLNKIIVNKCRDILKKRKYDNLREDYHDEETQEDYHDEETMWRKLIVDEALEWLNVKDKRLYDVVSLRFRKGLGIEGISKELRIPTGSVGNLLRKGLDELRDWFGDDFEL